MKELTRGQAGQIAGGDPGMVLAGGGGSGSGGGGGFGSGFGSAAGNVTFAGDISIWDWQGAVVTVPGTRLVEFDNAQLVAIYAPGEAPWEGQYLGHWVDGPPFPMSTQQSTER